MFLLFAVISFAHAGGSWCSDIQTMVKAGLPDEAVIAMVEDAPSGALQHDTGCAVRQAWPAPVLAAFFEKASEGPIDHVPAASWCDDFRALKKADVPDAALLAMASAVGTRIPNNEAVCIRALSLPESVESALRVKTESDEDRRKRELLASKTTDPIADPRKNAEAQVQWLASQAAAQRSTSWEVKVQLDEMTDSPTVIARSTSRDPIKGWLHSNLSPTLIARCKRGQLSLIVETGVVADDLDWRNAQIPAMARIDGRPAAQFTMGEATTHKALFFPQAANWIEALRHSERLLFEFTPWRSNPAQLSFDTRGFEHVEPLLTLACTSASWSPP